MIAVGAGALWWLGPTALRKSLASVCGWQAVLMGAGLGVCLFGVSSAYVFGLEALFPGGGNEAVEAVPLWIALLSNVAQPALLEEWLCRGVLWVALSRIATPGVTIFSTASLFALMHGLNGGYLFEIPHRLIAGLGLGALRHKTGSLVPCVVAHAVLNLLATLVGS